MFHFLTGPHLRHLRDLGMPRWKFWFMRTNSVAYVDAILQWHKTLPEATEEELHKKALGHIAWRQHKDGKNG
jgi:hypothetical protein